MPTQTKPQRKSPGRPLKLNHALIDAISSYVAKGNYPTTACQLCNISYQALFIWLQLADKDYDAGLTEENSLYLKLFYSLKRAEAEAEARLVAVAHEAAEVKREWIPAMTLLERRHPDRWGRKDRTQIDISEKKVIQITHVTVVEGAEHKELPLAVEGQFKELEEVEQA